MTQTTEHASLNDPVNRSMNGPLNGPLNGPVNWPVNGPVKSTVNAPVMDPNAAQRLAVRASIAQFQTRLLAAGQDFRAPPPEPTTCCGRGCNGCVWEGYDAALAWWYEEARALLGSSGI